MLNLVQSAIPIIQSFLARDDRTFRPLEMMELEARVLYSASPIGIEPVAGGSEAIGGHVLLETIDDWQESDSDVAPWMGTNEFAQAPTIAADPSLELASFGENLEYLSQQLDALSNELLDVSFNSSVHDASQIVFIDDQVDDWRLLADDIRQDPTQRGVEVVILDATKDGIEQMTEHLRNRSNVSAIHLVSHGNQDQLNIGGTVLTEENVIAHAGSLMDWQQALIEGADLLIYGCDLGATESGQSLLQTVAALCDCDVAASVDSTGHADSGGDWDLEFRTGWVAEDVIFSAEAQHEWQNELATFFVTDTSDSGSVGSLRWAVNQANANLGADAIHFNIAGTGTQRIQLNSRLDVTEAVSIDASTQAGYVVGSPVIELDGSNYSGGNADVFELLGDDIEIRGFSIIFADDRAIDVKGNNAFIAGNFIGLDANGDAAGNREGIRIEGDGTRVGSTNPSDQNVISSNATDGINIRRSGSGNVVRGNIIGSDLSGTLDRGNGGRGIHIHDGAFSNIVGGTNADEANLITFNDDEGVRINNAGDGNAIRGNQIFNNGKLEIDLDGEGVTNNDLTTPIADNDSGSNRVQNFPVFLGADFDGTTLEVNGEVSGRDFVNYEVDFYATTYVDSSGHGGAERYLGSRTILTDADGQVTFSESLNVSINAGEFVTATTTHSDGSTSEFSQAFPVAFTSSNTAPILDNSGDLLMVINQDDTNNLGLTIAQWLASDGGDPVTDVDGDPEGIAIIGFDDTNGRWEASPDGGINWFRLSNATPPSVNANRAIVLHDSTRLRFVPDIGYTGDSGAVTFRAWDRSDGTPDGTVGVDTTPPGGTTPFSSNTEQLIVRIADEIDAQADSYATNENSVLSGVNVLDNDNYVGVGSATLSVSSFDATSSLGATVSISSGGSLTYDPGLLFDSLEPGASLNDMFDYVVTDGNGNFETVQVQVRLDGVNDVPQISPQTFAINENPLVGAAVGVVAATDADSGPSGDLTYSIIGGTGQSVFAISNSGDITVIDAAAVDFEATTSFTLDVQVIDNAPIPIARSATMNIQITDVNEAPDLNISVTTGTVSENLDVSSRTKIADVVILDDAIGLNNLSLAGADAAFFELIGNELFLRSGVALDFDAQDRLDVFVVVDDAAVGGTPDATELVQLNVTEFIPLTPAIVIDPVDGVETNELGGAAGFEVYLSSPPASTVIVSLATDNASEGVASASVLTFTASNWSVPQVVLVTGQADAVVDGDVSFQLIASSSSTDASFDTLASSINIVNRDVVIIVAAPSAPAESTSEDDSDSEDAEEDLTGVIRTAPTSQVTVATASVTSNSIIDQSEPFNSEGQDSDSSQNDIQLIATQSDAGKKRGVLASTVIEVELPSYQSVEIASSSEKLTEQFFQDLDTLRWQMEADANLPQVVVGSVATMASALTVGYVTWLVRGGQLLVGVLAQMPVWRFVDPLPILTELVDDDEADDDSLASMVDNAEDESEADQILGHEGELNVASQTGAGELTGVANVVDSSTTSVTTETPGVSQ
ncbi:MAG: DUF4347 domain-containing protein [Planctomycetota bacterium]